MRVLARLLLVTGSLLLAVGLVAGVVNRQVLDGDRFAEHVDAVRADPAVARQLGLLVTDRLLEQQPDLTGLRPLIESASTALVASPALGPVVRTTVTPLHQALTSDDDDQVVLRLADVGALLVAAITTVSPSTEAVIPRDLDLTLASIGGQSASDGVVDAARLVDLLAWLCPLLGVTLIVVAGRVRERGWRSAVRHVGAGALAASGLVALLLVAGSLAASQADDRSLAGALGRAAWGELDGSLWWTAGLTAAVGLVLRAAGSRGSALEPATLLRRGRAALLDRGADPAAEALRAAIMLGAGVLLVLRPVLVVGVVGAVVGFLLALSGAQVLGRMAVLAVLERAGRPSGAAPRSGRPVVAVVAGVALVALLVVAALPASDDLPVAATVAAGDDACNGHVQLCDRRFDQVAFPATHNSMSAADQPGWFLGEQPHGILRQLDDGIRVLLVDSWNGQGTQRSGVVANTEESRSAGLAEAEATYGPELVQSALRLRDSLSLTPTGRAEPYLCHALCELGSTKWEPLMVDVKGWLDRHPREVVTFFVQDEVSAADTAALVERAGLMPYVHVPAAGEPWPTLGEMIASGRRVVFLLENSSGGAQAPWLIDSRTEVQDTPFSFTSADQFSCEPFRGTADAPLFLVNHWLSNYSSRVTDAREVNAEPVLLPRLQQCRDQRGRLPNFVAVDNYDQGDLLSAVDVLNGVD
ncbi:hypothetical protein [Aeromicrobium sp. Root472D3]|uniref:hypothetical protein n=1 Tax=Aeromicrobium sp. Root472D3 TaxID=1736540 RepID=UPI0006F41CEA|nr:hypothetical protein [Aeromicrobium sp. Root472D3]